MIDGFDDITANIFVNTLNIFRLYIIINILLV